MATQKQVNYQIPFITLVVLFFFVGFLTTVNGQFQGPLKNVFLSDAGELKNTFATLISFAWFLAYPLTGRTASACITRYGYKNTLILGLLLLVGGLGFILVFFHIHSQIPPIMFFNKYGNCSLGICYFPIWLLCSGCSSYHFAGCD